MREYGWIVIAIGFIALIIYARRRRLREIDMFINHWDFKAKLCGNCKFWPLSGYYEAQKCNGKFRPDGRGGNSCDGSMSDCRASLPGAYEWPGYGVQRWPQVGRSDWCKQFERRR